MYLRNDWYPIPRPCPCQSLVLDVNKGKLSTLPLDCSPRSLSTWNDRGQYKYESLSNWHFALQNLLWLRIHLPQSTFTIFINVIIIRTKIRSFCTLKLWYDFELSFPPIRKLRKKIISWNPNNPWFIQYFRFVGGPSKLKSITTHFQTIQRNANQPHVGDLDVQQLTLLFARATVNTVLLYICQGCWHWQRHFFDIFKWEAKKANQSYVGDLDV